MTASNSANDCHVPPRSHSEMVSVSMTTRIVSTMNVTFTRPSVR
jgi:hypothetical protein